MDARAVNVRNRDAGTKARGKIMSLDETVKKLVQLKKERRLGNSLEPAAEAVPLAQHSGPTTTHGAAHVETVPE